MVDEATGPKLGRLVGRARQRSSETTRGLRSRAGFARHRQDAHNSTEIGHDEPENNSAEHSAFVDSDMIAVDLIDAVARAESAEAENERLRGELARKEEILAEARIALRTARLALRDHLRITQR